MCMYNVCTLSLQAVFIYRSRVRLIRSDRAGVGKSLQKQNLCSRLRNSHALPGIDVTIPAYRQLKTDDIIDRLKELLGNGYKDGFDTIHLDIAHEASTNENDCLLRKCKGKTAIETRQVDCLLL